MNKLIRISLCFIVLLSAYSSAMAQNREWGNIWVQGDNLIFTTTFNGVAPPLNQLGYPVTQLYFHLGNSNISDSAGNLQLVSDGGNIYDKNLNLIDGGDTIVPKLFYQFQGGSSGLAQSSIILPFANGKYRVITPTASDHEVATYWNHPDSGRALFDLLLYNEVDMGANAGAGKVIRRMVPLLQNVKLSKAQMMACRHGDGKSWWLLKQASDTNLVYKFLFTDDKVYGPYIQGFAEPHFTKWDICGQAMFSEDGTRYATTIQGARKLFIADFDRCSGALSNPRVVDVPMQRTQNPTDSTQGDSSTCGLAFSPSGRFLYVNGFFTIQQFDLQDGNPLTAWTALSGPDTSWQEFQQYSNIYPGPNGKLYIGNWSGLGGQMSVIDNPDIKGTGANFCRKCLRFPGYLFQGVIRHFGVTTPPSMPNYRLGASNPICFPAGIPPAVNTPDFAVYPNPASTFLFIRPASVESIKIYDALGKLLISFEQYSGSNGIDVSSLASGMYLIRVSTSNASQTLKLFK